MTRDSKPPFDPPLGLTPIERRRLKGTRLVRLYELNKEDFHAVVTLMCAKVLTIPDRGALDTPNDSFGALCYLLSSHFLAAPSETTIYSRDEVGNCVNVFGEAILDSLDDSVSIQELYAYDGIEKHAPVLLLIEAFVKYVAIDALHGLSLEDTCISAARQRISELKAGSRKLVPAPLPGNDPFH